MEFGAHWLHFALSGPDGFVAPPPPPATVSRTKSVPAVAPSPLGGVRTAADVLAGRRASVGGIELDLKACGAGFCLAM